MKRLACAAAGVCVWLSSQPAAAETAGSLRVTRPVGTESCPDEAALWKRALSHGAQPRAGVLVEVELGRTADGYRASLRLVGSDTERRELQDPGPDCGPLAEAVAVALAILLTPADPRPLSPAPPASATPPATPPTPSPAAPPTTPATPALRLWAGLGGGAALGVTAPVAGLLSASIDLQRGALGAGVEVVHAPERELPTGEARVQLGATGASARGCYQITGASEGLAVRACAGASLRAMTARGEGFSEDRRATRLSPAATASLRGSGPISGRWGWGLALEALAPLRRETLSVQGLGVVHEPRSVGALMTLQLRWSIL